MKERPAYVTARLERIERELRELHPTSDVVRRILMQHWDPLCVSDVPECADDSYIPTICRLLIDRRTTADVANYLYFIQSDWMGLRRYGRAGYGIDRCTSVAERLLEEVGGGGTP